MDAINFFVGFILFSTYNVPGVRDRTCYIVLTSEGASHHCSTYPVLPIRCLLRTARGAGDLFYSRPPRVYWVRRNLPTARFHYRPSFCVHISFHLRYFHAVPVPICTKLQFSPI